MARAVGTGVGSNALEQGARMYYGKQEGFHWEQTLGAAVGGAALGRLTVGAGRAVEASRNVLARTAILTAGSGVSALLGDGATQAGAIYAGRQERFDLFQSATAFAGGALGGLVGSVAGAFDKTCFRAGTPLVCEAGYKNVEDLQVGDRLAARDEFDPDGPIEFKAIEEVFVRRGLIMEVTVGGQTIGTTAEHPFYVFQRGWTPAGELHVGDLLATADGRYLPVEKLHDTGHLETVYNFRVADHHTYFVADQDWGFEVWVHNAYGAKTGPRIDNRVGHNRKIRQVAREATARGETVIKGGRAFDGKTRKEAVIATPGGFKESRRPDILVRRGDGSIYGINVGLSAANGAPITRERLAIQDLNEMGYEMEFVPYKRRKS